MENEKIARDELRSLALKFVASPEFEAHYSKLHLDAAVWRLTNVILCCTIIGIPSAIYGLFTSRRQVFKSELLRSKYVALAKSGRIVEGYVIIQNSLLQGDPNACLPALIIAATDGTEESDKFAHSIVDRNLEEILFDREKALGGVLKDETYVAFRRRSMPREISEGRDVYAFDVKIDNALYNHDAVPASRLFFLVSMDSDNLILQIPFRGRTPPPLPPRDPQGKSSPVFAFDGESPAMKEAFISAQMSFKHFWREVSWERRRIIPGLGMAMVKIPFTDGPRKDGLPSYEHMWVDEVDFDGVMLSGKLYNSPKWLTSVRKGDSVRAPFPHLSDWLITAAGKAYGGFTVNLIRAGMALREREQHDDAWQLDFGDPSSVRVEITRGQGASAEHSGSGQNNRIPSQEFRDHPMCINMLGKIEAHIKSDLAILSSPDREGWLFLHREALAGNFGVVKLLVHYGADVTLRTKSGRTASELAREVGWPEIADFLDGRARSSENPAATSGTEVEGPETKRSSKSVPPPFPPRHLLRPTEKLEAGSIRELQGRVDSINAKGLFVTISSGEQVIPVQLPEGEFLKLQHLIPKRYWVRFLGRPLYYRSAAGTTLERFDADSVVSIEEDSAHEPPN